MLEFPLVPEGFAYWKANSPEAAPNTRSRYLTSLRTFLRWGLRSSVDVTMKAIADFVTARLSVDAVERGTVNGDLGALVSILRAWRPLEPALKEVIAVVREARQDAKLPRRRRAPHLSVDQVEELCLAARRVEPRMEAPIRVCTLSGLRVGELARLHSNDIRGRVIHVKIDPSLGEYGRIKTREERGVPVCEPLARILALRAPGFTFPSGGALRHGRASPLPHLSWDSLWEGLRRSREEAGLPWVTWPTLRHTRASWWAQAGAPRTKIAEWLGNSESVCERYYIGLKEGYDPDCERMPAARPPSPPSEGVSLPKTA